MQWKNRYHKALFSKSCFQSSIELPVNLPIEWGFYAHKKINSLAINHLPYPLAGFYLAHQDFIESKATAPDIRRHASKGEAARHYIDLDFYPDSIRFNMPQTWQKAHATFGKDTLQRHGIVPYTIQMVFRLLVKSWKEKDTAAILRYSADLGHYVGDAHVPLHTTANYDGQYSHQEGIHAFWESTLPENYFETYQFWGGKAQYLVDIKTPIWEAVYEAHKQVDKVLNLEKTISQKLKHKSFGFIQTQNENGDKIIRTYDKMFMQQYHKSLDGMVERQMRASILLLSSLWYTAWIEAGQPKLISFSK